MRLWIVITLSLLTIIIFFSCLNTEVPEQEVQDKYTLDIEGSYEITDTHQVKQSFSVQNTGTTASTNVVVEVYLLAPEQNVSQDFKYIDHKQMNLGIVNPSEKTNEYSVVVGVENPGSDYSAYLYVKATSAEGNVGTLESDVFSVSSYSRDEFYQNIYCDKIDPYNIDVRKAASEAVEDHPGQYSIDQVLDIYDWVKENIQYLNVPVSLPSTPYTPSQTLATKSGDCKNQAALIASMIESIGGTARVVAQPSCTHAYALVRFTDKSSDLQDYIDRISDHYFPCKNGFMCGGKCWNYPSDIGAWCDGHTSVESDKCSPGEVGFTDNLCHWCESDQTLIFEEDEGSVECQDRSGFSVNWFNYRDGKWVIFDPAGGFYPGDTISDCIDDEEDKRYFIDSCVEPPK